MYYILLLCVVVLILYVVKRNPKQKYLRIKNSIYDDEYFLYHNSKECIVYRNFQERTITFIPDGSKHFPVTGSVIIKDIGKSLNDKYSFEIFPSLFDIKEGNKNIVRGKIGQIGELEFYSEGNKWYNIK